MQKIKLIVLAFVSVCLPGWSMLHAQVTKYNLKYDAVAKEYVVSIIPAVNITKRIVDAGSQVTVLFPGSAALNGRITTVSKSYGQWNTSIYLEGYSTTGLEIYKTWTAAGSSPANFTANTEYELFRFKYTAASACLSGIRLWNTSDPADAGITGLDFSNYFLYNGGQNNDYSGNVTNTGLTCSELPEKSLGFNAYRSGSNADLEWITTQESGSKDFVIERSGNGTDWQPIATVKSKGNNDHQQENTFTDVNVQPGVYYYRLHQRGIDGKSAYSEVRSLTFDATALTVYPNPVKDLVNVTGLKRGDLVQLSNELGQTLFAGKADGRTLQINLDHYRTGNYILRVLPAGNNGRQKVFKLRKQ